MTIITVFFQMLSLLIMIGAGYIAAKRDLLDSHTCSQMSSLIVSLFNPLLALSSAAGAAGQIPLPRLGIVALAAVGMFVFFGIAGALLSPLFDKDPRQRSIYHLMIMFSNLGFIGIPVVTSILGAEYVVYVTEFIIIYNLVFYTYGVALMEGRFSLSSLKAMASLGNLLTVAALVVVVSGVQLPGFLKTAISYLGGVASPMALMTVGFTLAHSQLGQIFGSVRLYCFSLLKLLVLPLVMLPLVRLLPMDPALVPLCLIMFGMPVGNMPLILGTQKGIDCTSCSAGIIMTTLLCVFTIPILMAIV